VGGREASDEGAVARAWTRLSGDGEVKDGGGEHEQSLHCVVKRALW